MIVKYMKILVLYSVVFFLLYYDIHCFAVFSSER